MSLANVWSGRFRDRGPMREYSNSVENGQHTFRNTRKREKPSIGDSSSEDVSPKSKRGDQNVNPFDFVPNEVMVEIFSYLDPFSVKQVSGVNRRFRSVTKEFGNKLQKMKFKYIKVRCDYTDGVKVHIINLDFYSIDLSIKSKEFKIITSRNITEQVVYVKSMKPLFKGSFFVVHQSVKGLATVLKMFLNNSIVEELVFFKIDYKPAFCETLLSALRLSCSIGWLKICNGRLYDISFECFGKFIAIFVPSNLDLSHMSYQKDNLDPKRGNHFMCKAIEMNPQLNGIRLGHGVNWISNYGNILPIHIFEDGFTHLEDIVVVVKEWTAGSRDLIEIKSRINDSITLERFLEMTGAVLVTDNSIQRLLGYSKIVNCNGEHIFLKLQSHQMFHCKKMAH